MPRVPAKIRKKYNSISLCQTQSLSSQFGGQLCSIWWCTPQFGGDNASMFRLPLLSGSCVAHVCMPIFYSLAGLIQESGIFNMLYCTIAKYLFFLFFFSSCRLGSAVSTTCRLGSRSGRLAADQLPKRRPEHSGRLCTLKIRQKTFENPLPRRGKNHVLNPHASRRGMRSTWNGRKKSRQ